MNIDFELTIERFNGRDVCVIIDVTGRIENDGIGSYEYWGAKGFDAGTDSAEMDDWSIVSACFIDNGTDATLDGELRAEIEAEVKRCDDEIHERLAKEMENEPDFDDHDDRHEDW